MYPQNARRDGTGAGCLLLGLMLLQWTASPNAYGQDIHATPSGAVQGVRAGVSQNVRAGVIARGPGGEQAGAGGFATSDTGGHVISGRVAGYGARLGAGGQQEYGAQGAAGFSSAKDFPKSDFVATMPAPNLAGFTPLTGFGITLSTPPSTIGRSRSYGTSAHRGIKDPDAILNPFTHIIGPSMPSAGFGGGSLKPTVLGPAKN